jgi:rod shape-determining protein MreC
MFSRRAQRLDGHGQLFLILLAASVISYSVNRFLQVRFFALPAMVIMAPRSLVGGMFETMNQLRRENQRLDELCVRQTLDVAFWRDLAGTAARESLSSHYNFRKAAVIGRDPQSLRRTLIVDKGLLSGVRNDMPVITDAGVAGKVIEAGANVAFVATLMNPRVKVAALDQRSRVIGVISSREGSLLNLDYIQPDQDIQAGDTIVTSGTGGVFPKGLGIGAVVKADSAQRGMFRPITVRPFVNVGALENVYVIEPKDWSLIEYRRKEAEDELRLKHEKELRKLLEDSRIEVKTGEPGQE